MPIRRDFLCLLLIACSYAYLFGASSGTSNDSAQCLFHSDGAEYVGSCGRLFGQTPVMRLKAASSITTGVWRQDLRPISIWAGDMSDQGNPNAPLDSKSMKAAGVSCGPNTAGSRSHDSRPHQQKAFFLMLPMRSSPIRWTGKSLCLRRQPYLHKLHGIDPMTASVHQTQPYGASIVRWRKQQSMLLAGSITAGPLSRLFAKSSMSARQVAIIITGSCTTTTTR